ncbi:hypothetical protein [Halobaculum rubrum]|uniref:hypothetical protein n=1 Tax=Halobaculum rubrum TaxID=2872158 RepID=UPI001CA3BAB3|nr:hypothetical protein [Halobaculum rubrum]QZX98984.1 hypothetical protein K6T25_12030 [Halobaculum rubrum]
MTDTPDRFWSTLRREIRFVDCVALSVVPVVLAAVFLLPPETRMEFAFTYRRPTVLTAFTAHFVHRSLEHLVANVAGYVLLAGLGYVLAVLADERRLFGLAATTYLFAFPPVLSALNLAVPRNAVGYGFSGVTMAFAGLLAVMLAAYAGRRLHPAVSVRHAPAGFLSALAAAALLVPTASRVATAVAGVAALGAFGYAVSGTTALRDGPPHATLYRSGWVDLFALGAVVFAGYPVVGFPSDLRVGTAVVNTYVHLLGFCLAFLVAYLVAATEVLDGDA